MGFILGCFLNDKVVFIIALHLSLQTIVLNTCFVRKGFGQVQCFLLCRNICSWIDFRVYALEFLIGFYFHWHWILMLYNIVVLISLGFWCLALHEFKKFQIFVIFALYQESGMLQTTTLKRNLVPRFGKARKIGFGKRVYSSWVGYHP